MKIKFEFVFLTALFLITLLSLPSLVYSDASDNVTIDVEITKVTEIELNETALDFGSVAPTQNSSVKDVEIENVGSATVNNMHAHVFATDNETSNPIGTGDASNYAATTFLAIKNESASGSNEAYHYAGHQVWNNTEDDGSGWTFSYTASSDTHGYGSLWLAGADSSDLYYWELINGTDGDNQCNETGTQLNVKTSKDSKDMSGGLSSDSCNSGGGDDWGYCTFSDGPLQNYCAATYYDCTKFYLYRWDKNTTVRGDSCGTSEYLFSENFDPGATAKVFSLKMVVGSGIPDGSTSSGALQIYATTV